MDAKINHLTELLEGRQVAERAGFMVKILENRLVALELSKALEDLLAHQDKGLTEAWQRAYDAAQAALDDADKKLGVTRKSQGRD